MGRERYQVELRPHEVVEAQGIWNLHATSSDEGEGVCGVVGQEAASVGDLGPPPRALLSGSVSRPIPARCSLRYAHVMPRVVGHTYLEPWGSLRYG